MVVSARVAIYLKDVNGRWRHVLVHVCVHRVVEAAVLNVQG